MWIWQAISGALLLILAGMHMITQHYVVEGGLRTYADVVAYAQSPLFLVLETAFLIVVVGHALMGVRAIVLDLGISTPADRNLKIGLTALGAAMIVYGLWLTFSIA